MVDHVFEEAELTSAKLSDLTKIPAKDFEKQFREWMERDDVARSLQAKLRYDLIANFNKTTLGRHIISQTTMTTRAHGTGKLAQRLTLSPLILALNTLVAEFLYAENCHFSLSIFCTEVPFRNTLPNFEQKGPFRFTTDEIYEILEAIAGHMPMEHDLKLQVIQKYIQLPTNASLLLLLLQALVERRPKITTETKYVQVQNQPNPITKATMTNTSRTFSRTATTYKARGFRQRPNAKNMLSANFRKLNRYLATLTHKISENAQQFEQQMSKPKETNMQKKTNHLPFRKGAYLKSYLINMTEQLRQMSNGKQYNRQLNNLEQAIILLGKQFESCANNLVMASKDVEKSTVKYAHKATNTVQWDSDEKSYAEWVHELRETRNGQKFLDRIENSLRKALNNQKLDLQTETNRKLEHQKAILKIHYRQKLLDHISRESQAEIMTSRCHGDLEEQLKELQIQYGKLLQRIENNEAAANLNADTQDAMETTVKHLENSNTVQQSQYSEQKPEQTEGNHYHMSPRKSSKSKKKKMYNKYMEEKQLRQQMQNMLSQEPQTANNLVIEAKLRLLELDQESNQLENNLSNCLERQRIGKKFASTDSLNAWERYTVERHRPFEENSREKPQNSLKICATKEVVAVVNVDVHQKENEKIAYVERKEEQLLEKAKFINLHNSFSSDIIKHEQLVNIDDVDVAVGEGKQKFTNPIALAKKKFFENESRMKYRKSSPVEELKFNRVIETTNLEIAAERITEQIIPKLSTFLDNFNNTNLHSKHEEEEEVINKPLEAKGENEKTPRTAEENEDKKNETVIILQRSTEKLNKLFSSSRENIPTSPLDDSIDNENENEKLINDRTFIKTKK